MKTLIFVSSLLLATACKGGLDAKLDELGKVRDAMCACKDKACADEQHEKYIAWKKGNSKDDKPSEDQMKKFETIRHELQECRHKVSGGGGDMPTPVAPEGSGSAAAPTP